MEPNIIWEAHKIEKPEFRLYYNDDGEVVCYSCEKLDGNYIVIDAQTFAESRMDVVIVDKKITKKKSPDIVSSKSLPDTLKDSTITATEITIWEAPIVTKPEFRLYYNEKGEVVTYSCEKLEGNYIVIDALTFAEARYDIKVINGTISRLIPGQIVSKLIPDNNGTACADVDISVVLNVEKDKEINESNFSYRGKTTYWKLKNYAITI